jgi:hypothetical protein
VTSETDLQGRISYIRTSAFNEAQRWCVGELRKSARVMQTAAERDLLLRVAGELENAIADDLLRARYAVYLDHFEAAAKREAFTLAPSTLEERVSAAAGTMDATPAGIEGPRLLSIREHITECDRLLSWDEPAAPQDQAE